MGKIAVSVIIASDREGPDLDGCLDSLAAQVGAPEFEVIVASAERPPERQDLLLGWVRMEERNPAARRNRAAAFAAGGVLAFLDDDARAAPDWLARGFAKAAHGGLVGGRDLLPPSSPVAERISDMLVATPLIGSAVAAHERCPKPGPVARPWALTLCNLFVGRELFESLNGLDEAFGYIGEDTDFLDRALRHGATPEMDPGLVVFHRRRRFPAAFLAQRWRYRFKTGKRLLSRGGALPRGRIAAFLLAGASAAAAPLFLGPPLLAGAAALYAGIVWTLSFPIWRRDPVLFLPAPAAFALHHADAWLATICGLAAGAATSSGKVGGPSRVKEAG